MEKYTIYADGELKLFIEALYYTVGKLTTLFYDEDGIILEVMNNKLIAIVSEHVQNTLA